jgi:alkylation response protein AidB-like acyl-CoA dehydrogenase
MAENFFSRNRDIQFYVSEYIDWKPIIDMKENYYQNPDQDEEAPANFEEALDHTKTILDYVGHLAGEIIDPNAAEVDRQGAGFDAQNQKVILPQGIEEDLEQLGESGLLGISLPRKYGGLNCCQTATTIASELLGSGDAALMTIACLQWGVANVIWHFADEEVKAEYLPKLSSGEYKAAMVLTEAEAGSDLGNIRTTAEYDEGRKQWIINGTKRFITNGQGEVLLLLARSEPDSAGDVRGISLFLVEGKDAEVTRIEEKLGIHGSPTCEMIFENSPGILIGKRRFGLIKHMYSLMNEARLGVAAQGLGIAQAAYDHALKYADEREQFGRKIRTFPPVADLLVTMKMEIEATRALIYKTVWFVDMYMELERHLETIKEKVKSARGAEKEALKKKRDEMRTLYLKYQRYANVLTPLSKMRGGRMVVEVTDSSIQVLGGYGYMSEFPVERYFRDGRIIDIYEGTGQMQAKAAISGILNKHLEPLIDEIGEKAASQAKVDKELKSILDQLNRARQDLNETIDHVLTGSCCWNRRSSRNVKSWRPSVMRQPRFPESPCGRNKS